MVPKPFPYPLNIGTDLCSVKRIAGLLDHRRRREQFIRRNFTRLEWPLIWKSFQRASDDPNSYDAWITPNTASVTHTEQTANGDERPLAEESSIWSLPDWSKPLKFYTEEVLDESSPIGSLVRHVAGRFVSDPICSLSPKLPAEKILKNHRWAAKEAVIKAHAPRQLYMNEISIITPRLCPYLFSIEDAQSLQTKALIDPPSDSILMSERVAWMRGLRGFGPRSKMLSGGAVVQRDGQYYYRRRSKIKESERQMAGVSISHDGVYAVAMCMASTEQVSEARGGTIIDDGEGPRMHEPSWGDEGWFNRDSVDYEGSKHSADYRMAVEDALKGAQDDIMSND